MERIYYMDNVRALAMLMGVFFHAAIPYGPLIHDVWFMSDQQNSWLMDFPAWLSHLFRMPVFFIVAGFFAQLLVLKRGVSGFLKNRATRILVPFIIFWPVIGMAMLLLLGFALETVDAKSPMLQFIADNVDNPEAEPVLLSTMHLWFLYHLVWFCVLAALFVRVKSSVITRCMDRIFSNPWHFIYLPFLLIPGLFVNSVPLPAPERIYPQLWSFGYFGLFFLFGWHLFNRRNFFDVITPYWKHMMGFGFLLYIGIFLMIPDISLPDVLVPAAGYDFSITHIGLVVMEAYSTVYLTIAILVAGKKYLDTRHAGLRYISDASYWIYIIHLPVLFLIQINLMDVAISIWFKFLISSCLTCIVGVVSYEFMVRYTPLGTLLNGKKKRGSHPSLLKILSGSRGASTDMEPQVESGIPGAKGR